MALSSQSCLSTRCTLAAMRFTGRLLPASFQVPPTHNLLCCLRGRLPASIKNNNAGSKPPRGGQGGLYDDLTPELRSSRCNERCCCRCLARDCARCNQVAARVELSEEHRRSVGSEPDARQIRERDE